MSVWKQTLHKHSKCLSSPFFELSFTPRLISLQTPLPHPCGSHSVPLVQQQIAQELGSEHNCFSAVLNSFPLFLCWSSMSCRPCSTCVAMEKLPLPSDLVIPLFSPRFLCLLPVQCSCSFLNILSQTCHHVTSVAQQCPEVGLLMLAGTNSVREQRRTKYCYIVLRCYVQVSDI